MAYLINRNPSGRLICLHALCGYIYNRFHTSRFSLNDLKFDATCPHNIHHTCTLLQTLQAVNYPVCPYLDNPLSQAKCYLTQSMQEDKQKSKSASDAFHALEGLGFICHNNNQGYLTNDGVKFAKNDYSHPDTYNNIRNAVKRYGPFWTLLFLCNKHKDTQGIVKREDIKIGYPETQEILIRNGHSVILSTGSQRDTITRTRSVLFTWGVTAGFLMPLEMQSPKDASAWHVNMLPFIKNKKWMAHSYKVFIDDNVLDNKPYVERPLSYNAMTKSTKALRERNQEEQRSATLELEKTIKNRRFAICYLLALAAEEDCGIDFDSMVNELALNDSSFVIDKHNFVGVMRSELDIAFTTGIPFNEQNRILFPLTRLNMDELSLGAPKGIIESLQSISKKVMS